MNENTFNKLGVQKDSKKVIIIMMFLLGILLICFGGYLTYNNFIEKKENKEKSNNENEANDKNQESLINLNEDESQRIFGIFNKIIIWNWGNDNNKVFTYFATDLSRATAVFYNNNSITRNIIESGYNGMIICYKFDELNDLSIKVFGQGVDLNIIKDDFYSTGCQDGYIGHGGGKSSVPMKIKELRYNESTKFYTLEIVEDTSESLPDEYKDILYKFQYKFADGVDLSNITFEGLRSLSGKKIK